MKNSWRILISLAIAASALAFLWSADGQQYPDKYFLYVSGLVLVINAVGIGMAQPWVRVTWPIVLLGAAAFAVTVIGQPFWYPMKYGPVSIEFAPMIAVGLIPIIIAAGIEYRLPALLARKS